jgi:hypothetical protein
VRTPIYSAEAVAAARARFILPREKKFIGAE